MIEKKIYLGDSVYAEWKDNRIILTTENGLPEDPSNLIYLEIEVIEELIKFWLHQNHLLDDPK